MSSGLQIIELTEHRATESRAVTKEVARALNTSCKPYLDIQWDFSHEVWQLQPKGVVGYIPVDRNWAVSIKPKVPLANLFRMLEVAYQADIRFPDGMMQCESIVDFYNRLAKVLAKRVLDRARKGLYRAYVDDEAHLSYVRGRIDLRRCLRPARRVGLHCHYQEHTGDIEDNQILAWTLYCIARSGLCNSDTLGLVRSAYRVVENIVSPTPVIPEMCARRLYNRLNSDYEPMHGLCRFFLERTGPTVNAGDRSMLPFVVDMPRLFELFVANWLKEHLPHEYRLKAQERVHITEDTLYCDIDLVLYLRDSDTPIAVLDTKYKNAVVPAHSDLYQIVAYAEAKGCDTGFLIYPSTGANEAPVSVGKKTVHPIVWSLDEDPDVAGQRFLEKLFSILE